MKPGKHLSRRERRTENSIARMNHYCRRRRARVIASLLVGVGADPRAIELLERRRPEVRYIITRDTYPEGAFADAGNWRATRIDQFGPSSHFFALTPFEALYSLTGFRLPRIGLPHGSAGEFVLGRVL